MPIAYLLIAIAWLLFHGALALQAKSPPERYAVDVWEPRHGLPQSSVLALTMTRDGYLWVGTMNGLARFDGTRFVVFDESNTPDLDSSPIIRLFEDSQTNLWIGTDSGAILFAREGKITRAGLSQGPPTPASRLMSIAESTSGDVWLYTASGQLGRFSQGRLDVGTPNFGATSQIRTLAADADGLMWIGTGNLLVGMDEAGVKHSVTLPRVDLLLSSKRGGYWRLANNRIEKCSGTKVERDLGPYPWRAGLLVPAACEDNEGNLVVGTYGQPGEGVFWFRPDGKAEHVRGLSHSSILSLTVDREGSLWVGTDGGGLNRVRPQAFETLESSQGLTVQSVAADPRGGLWIGYNWDRVDFWHPSGSRQYQLPNASALVAVRSVFVDSNTNVWVGAFNGGLFRFGQDAFAEVPGVSMAAGPHVSAIFEDGQGAVWLGTHSGLIHSTAQSWRRLTTAEGLSGNHIQAIAQDKEGNIWAGTAAAGLNRISKEGIQVFNRTNGLPSDSISALFCDSTGVLWIGTPAGLVRFETNRLSVFTMQHGLTGNSIRYLLEDDEGFLWIGSNAGLMRAAKDALAAFAAGRQTNLFVRAYGERDGVPTSEASQNSQPAATKSPDGKLWFSTTKGVAGLDPKQLTINTNPPLVVFEGIYIDGQRQGSVMLRGTSPSHVTVPPRREAIEIRFAALSLSSPEKIQYRHRLRGHENAWTRGTGNHGVAHHTRVPPGEYVFEVEAGNADNVWTPTGASVSFVVLPPFWQTWWFMTLSSLAGLALVIGIVHYVSTQKLQRQLLTLRQQEALERERARIARDLHDQLGANLTQVALLGEMAETDKDLPQEVESHARQISSTARETTRALDEIVWTVNPANDTLEGVANYLCKYAQEYFALADLTYRIEVPPDLPPHPISPEVRHNVFLAAKEAVNNVVKHAKAKSAWLRLRLEPGQFTVEVEDDGAGLPPEATKKGRNGLRNMRSRMEDVGGRFEVSPGQTAGTLVRLTAPLKTAPTVGK